MSEMAKYQLYMPKVLLDFLKQQAEKEDKPLARLIRRILADYVESHRGAKND